MSWGDLKDLQTFLPYPTVIKKGIPTSWCVCPPPFRVGYIYGILAAINESAKLKREVATVSLLLRPVERDSIEAAVSKFNLS